MLNAITKILNNLQSVGGVQAAVVVDRDGILIAKEETTEMNNAEELASLFARAIHSFERSTKTGMKGESIQQLIIERQGDEKLIMSVASTFILAVIAQRNINLGLLRIEMKETIRLLVPLLES
jgi:predicted regulator of Ras-like GTPase activity (Roadblock/LC7/MglB family)